MKKIFICLISLILIPYIGLANEYEINDLKNKVERLQNDLNLLQSEYYKKSASLESAPAMEARLINMQEQIRNLTGSIETINHELTSFNRALQNLEASNSSLISPGSAYTSNPAAPTTAAQPYNSAPQVSAPYNNPVINERTAVSGAVIDEDIDLNDSNNAGEVIIDRRDPISLNNNQPVNTQPGSNIVGSNVDQQYERGLNYLKAAQYDLARGELQQFINDNPDSPLVINAYYWLGETHFIANQYPQAASYYAKAYKNFPQDPQTADHLFKLALSLKHMNQVNDACVTLSKIKNEYKTLDAALLTDIENERTLNSCG